MSKEKTNTKKEKAFASISVKSFIVVVAILAFMLVVCGVLSLIVPQGEFARNANGEIIAGTYVQGEAHGIEFWRIITAPFRVFAAEGSLTIIMICLFLLIMSGVFNLLEKTNGIKVIMNKIVQKFEYKKRLVICLAILFFMLFGSFFGLFEELVTLLPFVTIFMLSLGFDTMTGLGVCMLASCFGFSAAITNPFSVGIASSFAGINTISGIWLRIIFFILVYALVCLFVLSYTKKIRKKPEISLTYETDLEKKEALTAAYTSAPNAVVTPVTETVSETKLDWKAQKEAQAKERKRQNELKKTEERIAQLEEREAEIDELMTREDIYTNSVKCQELANEKAKNAEELEMLYEKWEELAE